MVDINNLELNDEGLSLKEVILKIGNGLRYLRLQYFKITIAITIGAISGLIYTFIRKPVYTATSTFVLDDNKGGTMGQYAGLASLAGIDIGSISSNGLFQGENILELYRSRKMIQIALLTPVKINGKNQLLIDRYINFNKLREKWRKKDNINSISFSGNPDEFNRKQDSLISSIVETITKNILDVTKPDKKLSILQVDVRSNDELFSKFFNLKLVETVNEFYTQTRTKKSTQNIAILQKQADSVKAVLNSSIGGVAQLLDASPNANPNKLILRAPSQKRQIDVQANSSIYAEIVKNLEISKLNLRQETPLIQTIDSPILPLQTYRITKLSGLLIGGLITGILMIAYLILKKIYVDIMHS